MAAMDGLPSRSSAPKTAWPLAAKRRAAFGVERRQFGDVGTGAEGSIAGACEHQHTQARVDGHTGDERAHLRQQLCR